MSHTLMKYEVIEAKIWRHKNGRAASIYGACPWISASDRENWAIEHTGFTVRNTMDGTIGLGRMPFATHAEAAIWCQQQG